MIISDLAYDAEDDWPEMPPFETDRYGNVVDTSGDVWCLCDPSMERIEIDWSRMRPGSLQRALQLFVCFSIRSHSPREVGNQFREILAILQVLGECPSNIGSLDIEWWTAVRQSLRSQSCEYRLHRPRRFYLWVADQELPDVDSEVAFELEQWTIPGNVKGEAVASRDGNSGPLNERQFVALTQLLRRKQPPTLEQAATFIGVELGPNPKAICLLEERDLHVFSDPTDDTKRLFQLDVPRIKKRLDRRETKRRRITPEAGAVLLAIIESNRARFGGPDPKRPILCREHPRVGLPHGDRQRFQWHYTSRGISRLVATYGMMNRLRCVGDKDDDERLIRLSPRRLRYTFACRLAATGAPPVLIAELLDHTDLQHVMVYVETGAPMVGRLSAALDAQLRPVIDLFMGRMLKGEDLAAAGNNLPQIPGRGYDGRLLAGIGVCGSGSLCKLIPPLTCYVCEHFVPAPDAPHQEMLQVAHDLRRHYVGRGCGRAEMAQCAKLVSRRGSSVSHRSASGK